MEKEAKEFLNSQCGIELEKGTSTSSIDEKPTETKKDESNHSGESDSAFQLRPQSGSSCKKG